MKHLLFLFTFCLLVECLHSQALDNTGIKNRIEAYKADIRGPYKDIRWFCDNGSVLPPKEKCPEPGGVQRARYKDEVEALATSRHIFLGQILSTTDHQDFWDASNYHSRLKQYQLEKYLRAIDEGWVLQKGQFYRGAFQAEDEEEWGIDFFQWLLRDDESLKRQFYLIRQSAKDIPHKGDNSQTQKVRALSKVLSDEYAPFLNLRVKIHGQPEASDIEKVIAFRDQHRSRLNNTQLKQFEELITAMKNVFQAVNLQSLNEYVKKIPEASKLRTSLEQYLKAYAMPTSGPGRAIATADQLAAIRSELLSVKSSQARLALLDLSNALEETFFAEISQWRPENIKDLLSKICYTGKAAMATGLLEEWEWNELDHLYTHAQKEEASLQELNFVLDRSRAMVEWGTGMVRGVYKEVVNLFGGFEPLAYGYFDDRIRGSVLLDLGHSVGQLGDFIAEESQFSNQVMKVSNPSHARGLNPGFARGELVVVSGNEEELEVSNNKIYLFHHPPSDLKPVAGIATVTEGNMVSHVQLLARNLGIPNAVISNQNLEELKAFDGQEVFYAVSNSGTVIMKPVGEMSNREEQLFASTQRNENRVSVPTDKIDLSQTKVINMRQVDATSSGQVCGPKAANLGQLKKMFPDNVVEGLVVPFGIFKAHLEQPMPGQQGSYWAFLNAAFQKAEDMRKEGAQQEAIEAYVLGELAILREAIKKIEFLPEFRADVEAGFVNAFGKKLGQVPVFLRSDTNMEDLKEFTGAGLNLTLFNVLDAERILQGIKDVWASPYTERSFKWRQRYLLNPENVYPSILIIPSVDVDYSGVLITKGVTIGGPQDLTVAFNRGAGGAVDGQAAESYLLTSRLTHLLLSPAREPAFRTLPESGGSKMKNTTFEQPILNKGNLYDIKMLAKEVYEKMPNDDESGSKGPYDVELGFKNNQLWLFQIRPFVENKRALSSDYLESISPKIDQSKMINLMANTLSTK